MYVLNGKVVLYPDGTGVDKQESDDVLYVQDVQTGELFTIAPNRISELAEPTDPQAVIAEREEAIAEREEAIAAATNQEIEQEEGAASGTAAPTEAPEVRIPAPRFSGARVTLDLPNGSSVNGVVLQETDDGVEVQTDSPVNGRFVQVFPTDEFDGMLSSVRDEADDVIWSREVAEGENAANGQQREMQGNGIPVDAKTGEPVYEAVAPDVAWDAIVQEAEGDEAMAMQVVTDMVADMEAKVQKAKKAKVRAGSTVRERLEAQKKHKRQIEEAEAQLEAWRRIAAVKAERIAAAERAKIEAAQQREVTQDDETEVPDFVFDKPENARERGYRMQNGQRADRQEPIAAAVGKEVSVKFTHKVSQPVCVAVVDARSLQPSHQNGQPNVLHFLPEAQPKKRTDHESVHAAEQMAAQMNPEEITSSVTAYTGAPSVNARGEVIQGNNRTAALKRMWQGYPEQAAAYKQYLMDHASEYGLNPEDIAAMEQPVLVNLMDVTDEQAIELGQYDVKDTESGGTERIKPRNVSQKMGDKAERFASILLRTTDEDASVSQLIDEHAVETLKWLEAQHYISPTQYRSAFNADGQVTPEAKNDLRGILYQAVFKNGSERLEDMFNALPTKAQRAILATAYRDFSTPESEKMLPEIQNSIVAFYELSQDAAFANAKNFEEARKATMAWLQQMQFDFSTGQSVSREGKYTNFALTLAAMYKVQTQTAIQQTFNDMFDLLQGRQQPDLLFNPNPNNTPRTLAEAIREVLNIEYDGTNGSHALGGNNETRTTGRQGSARDDSAGGTDAPGNAAADAEGGTVQTDNERGRQRNLRHTPRREKNNLSKTEELKFSEELDQNGHPFILSSDGTTVFGEITKNSGLTAAPIKLNEGFNKTDEEGNNIGYGLLHIQAGHGQQILEAGYPSVQKFVEDVCRNYKEIRIGRNRKSNQTYMLLELHDEKHKCTLYVELSHDGTYWNVNSGGIFRNKYTDKNDIVWPEPTVGSNANTDTAEVANNPTEVAKGETVDRGGNSSQPISSESKDTPQNSAVQTSGQENAETSLQSEVTRAEQQTNAEPTEGQKEAGNYKKGRVKVGPFDVVIEQPRGSVRSGVDANGKAWETTMQNTYGYFGGTKGVDGDAIDVFLGNDLDEWDGTTVFVVDQYNPDGSFDEHKVMLGFNSQEEAEAAYFANYESDWAKTHRTEVTAVPLADFNEWVNSSKRKTKAFAEYKVAKRNAEIDAHNAQNEQLAEQLFSMAKEAETEKDFFDRAASLFEVTGYESDLRDIYNGVKSGEIANARALSFYTNATLKPVKVGVKAGVKVKAPKSEQKQKAEAPRLATKNGKAGEKPRKHAAQPGASAVSTQEATLRDALVDVAQQSGLEVVVDEKAQQVLDEVNGRARTMAFGEEYDYDKYPEGRVEPNIADKYVHIERAKLDHGFANFNEAKEWAKSHIVRTLDNEESGGKGNVKISSTAVNKYLSESAVAKSDSKDVHLAVLKKLPEIIHDSVDVETTPDFKKDENGVRKVGNEINKNVLIHRCYGAVEINGNIYRVKITLKEYKDKNEANKAYSYEATKIELFAGTLANDRKTTTDPGTNNSISVAKLLKDVEMSYRPGVKVLEESAKQRARLREHRVFHGSGAEFDAFDHSHMGEGEGAQAYGWGTYVTEVEGIGRAYARNPWQMKINELESNISRAKEKLPFMPPSATKTELENNIKEWEEELAKLENGNKHLYTVEIPEDNGTNYLHWEKPLTREQIGRITEKLKSGGWNVVDGNHPTFEKNGERIVLNERAQGQDVYAELEEALGSDKVASEFLASIGFTGISYPAEALSGGRKDAARNFVIFNEKDAQITDHIRFFRTPGGEAYGFTVDGKIYLDPRIATAETPIHEYAHLWADMIRNVNTEAWNDIVGLMKATPIWEEVRGLYPELKTDDEIADEVLAHYSGRRGAERLREAQQHAAAETGKSVFERAAAVAAIERVKQALAKFWQSVAELFHIRFTSAEEVADRVLADMLNGVNPNKVRNSSSVNVAEFAAKHHLNQNDVKKYADSMKSGSLGGASYAFKSIKRSVYLANEDMSLSQFVKVFKPIKNELFSNFGNVEELREEHVQEALNNRNVMEAARKREEAEKEAERKRLEVFEQMSDEALDKAYMEAVRNNDERMRDLVNEAARRKGYQSTDEFRMSHRAPSYDEDGTDKSLIDVANNKDNIRDSLEEQFRMNHDRNREESVAAISQAIQEIEQGKNPTVTIYRAVPKSLKEGSVRNGDWVTLSEAYAKQHGRHALNGDYRIMKENVPAANLYWDGNDINEWGYDDKRDYKYKDTRNNRKLNDLIVRDDKGAIIPLSKRFNTRKKDVRFQFVGQQGAAALDKAEEATTRLDNLGVAREMERQQKDAKAIKLATGWERGGDGKWRYEIMDGELKKEPNVKEKVSSDGEVHYETTLGEILDNEQLYRSYPELRTLPVSIQQMDGGVSGIYLPSGYMSLSMGLYRHRTQPGDVRREIEQIESTPEYKEYSKYFEGDMPDAYIGREDEWEEAMNEAEAKFFESELGKRYHDLMWGDKRKAYSYGFDEVGKGVILHEVQHAIQHIEGFAMGGNSTTYREHLAGFREKYEAWSVIDEFEDKSKELGDDARPIDVYNALVREYQSLGLEFGDGFAPSREAFDKGFNLWTRGYDNEGYEDAYNEYQRLMGKFGSGEYNTTDTTSSPVRLKRVTCRIDFT